MEVTEGLALFEKATEAVQYLKHFLPANLQHPSVGVICGSGLGSLADAVNPTHQVEASYKNIPHFPKSTVQGHVGKLVFGFLTGKPLPVVLMVGRAHFYEGHSIHDITFPVRVLKLLGVNILIVTNAAGGLNPTYSAGDVVILNDHLNLAGLAGIHSLRGPNAAKFGPRFPALSDAYDLDLRKRAHKAWDEIKEKASGRQLHEGIYAFVGGPSYETRAESRMLHMLGADLVGMSTVPEIIVARHCGIRVLGLSLVTNQAVLEAGPRGDDASLEGLDEAALLRSSQAGKASHEEVLEAGRLATLDMQRFVYSIIQGL